MKKTFAFFLATLMLLTALTAFAEDDAPPADTPLTQKLHHAMEEIMDISCPRK